MLLNYFNLKLFKIRICKCDLFKNKKIEKKYIKNTNNYPQNNIK